MKLTIDLVPSSAWYSNLRSELTASMWDTVRKAAYKRASYKCEVCGSKGPYHPVECHEDWDWLEDKGIQRLSKITALCPDCHEVKHIGRAGIMGNFEKAMKHLMKVNNMSYEDADCYVEECFQIWRRRSELEWTLDISNLQDLLK